MRETIARELGIHRSAISQWGDTVPPKRVQRVSQLTGIAPHILCPDVFPSPHDQSVDAKPEGVAS